LSAAANNHWPPSKKKTLGGDYLQSLEGKMARSVEFEIALFRAIIKHRPLGLNKHFAMIGVQEMLREEMGREYSSQQIWQTLAEMYNLDEMDSLVCLSLTLHFGLDNALEFGHGNRQMPQLKTWLLPLLLLLLRLRQIYLLVSL